MPPILLRCVINQKVYKVAVSIAAIFLCLISLISPALASTNIAITSKAQFDAGTFSNTESSSKQGQVQLKGSGTWNARLYRSPDLTLNDGTIVATDGTYTYMIIGRDIRFSRYLPEEDRWQSLADSPHMPYVGADMVYFNNDIYVIYGGLQKVFSRYSVANNTWEDLPNLPELVYTGASIQTDGTYLYIQRGNNTTDFWRYNPSTLTFTTLNTPPAGLSGGADLIYDNSLGTGYLYTPRGASTTTFYQYDISANTWSTMATAPGTVADTGNMTKLGDYIYMLRGLNTLTFYRYKISTNTWETLTDTPAAARYVGITNSQSENKLYVFRGNNTYDWWKYDPDTNSFLGNSDLPATPGSGADVIYLNNEIYYRRGNGSANFYKFSIATNTWTTLTSAPATFADDTKGITAGGNLYFLRGSNTTTFYRYNVAGNTWTTLSSAPANVGAGASLAYPGSGNYVYATRGNGQTAFWRYDMVGDTWDDPAVADLPTGIVMNTGARLVSDGTDVFAITGIGMQFMYKYLVAGNSWSQVSSLPFSPYWGTDGVVLNGRIYFQAGYFKTDLWEYAIATNTWNRLPDISGQYANDIGPYNGGSLAADTSNSVLYSISGANLVRLHSFTPGSTVYVGTGSWTSEAIDLGYVSGWQSLIADTETNSDSQIQLETRTSADKATWSSWVQVSGTTIQSSQQRYIQVRAILTSSTSGDTSPILRSITVNYYGDEVVPTNPNSISGSSQTVGGIALTSGNNYPYPNPYFTWSGATDGETAVAGYYVYFGSDQNADPRTEGTYQTNTTYTVTKPMSTGDYFLRIKTIDTSGNVSSATTIFMYGYNGVSPPQSITHTSTSEFIAGTTSNVNVSNDAISLAGKSGFWVQSRLSFPPAGVHYGAGLAYNEQYNKLYTFRGFNTSSFYSYDIENDTWATLSSAPAAVYQGGDLVEGPSGYLFGTPGRNLNTFWRYEIATDTWSDAAAQDAPFSFYYGSSMVYDGSRYIYVLRGNNDDAFMRYDAISNVWDTLSNTDFGVPNDRDTNNAYLGADLAYDSNDLIYAIQGNWRSGFSVYNVQTDSWAKLPNLPVLPYDGSQIAYDSGTNSIFYTSGWTNPFIYAFNISTQTWTKIPDTPAPTTAGSTMRIVNNQLYLLRGAGTNTFWKYNIQKQSWQTPNMGLFGVEFRGTDYRSFGLGADIIKGDGDYYYLVRGNFDNLFVRYDATTGESVQMARAPGGFYAGGTLVYDSQNQKIYAIPSQYIQRLYTYDIATDVWSEELSDPPPVSVLAGSVLQYDGSRFIYWIRGGSNSFYRFDTQGNIGAKWTSMANLPGTTSYGADMIIRDGYIYALQGNNQIAFYRYDIALNTWSNPAVADLPAGATIGNDGFLIDSGGDTLYACRGVNQTGCYQYSISGDSWSTIANAPANIYQGGSAATNKQDRIFAIAGNGTNTYSNGLYSYIMQTDTSSFEELGSYISETIDLSAVYKFANLHVAYTSAYNTGLSVYTRSSSDGLTFSSWTEASELKVLGSDYVYSLNSAPNRYIQIKFDLTSSDGIYSGTISDYSIYYYQDIDVPTNASVLSAFSTATQSASLSTNNWYNNASPYFDWPDADQTGGATDTNTGAGVNGYYVYFGSDQNANPATSGTLRSESNYEAQNLITGQTYYLRLKTIDNAGNVSTETWQPFIYKYDSTQPNNPSTLVANPPGYSAANSFTFSWSGASDSGSGVAEYCYKTGATLSTDTCTTETSISGIQAYQTGSNTFYVRVKDAAGNFSSDYITATYYYSSTAPGGPLNLQVEPASNTLNAFGFVWQPPETYYGSQSGLRYFYSVNALPTANNVNAVGLENTYLPQGSYATQKGTNIFYVVAKDEAGNIDYNNYSSVEFSANTAAPGIPINVEVADVSVKETSSWKIATSWEPPASKGSGIANYKIFHSTQSGASCTSNFDVFTNISTTTGKSYVDTDLEQVTHYYCIKACTSTNDCSAPSDTISLLPDGRWRVPASLIAEPGAVVQTRKATITWITGRAANSFVKFGKSSGKYGEEVGSSDQVTDHEVVLTNLDPGTTYYYKTLWTDEDGNLGESDEYSFVTNAAPFVSSVKVTNISLYESYVNFTVKSAVKATIQYGQTQSYGAIENLSTSKSESNYTVKLSGLTDGTLYHLRIVAEDEEGNVYNGDDYTFETLPVPKISNLRIQQVEGMPTATLRLLWISNTRLTSVVTYYPLNKQGQSQDSINLTARLNHEVILTDLLDETDYVLLIKGKDAAGNEAKFETRQVKTALDLRPPEISNINVESTVVGVGEDARAQIIISWDSDEASTSQIEYGQGTSGSFSSSTQEDSILTFNHSVVIPGLVPSKIYHFRIVSKDKNANKGVSADTVVITPNATQDALNLVVNRLSKTFGFLKR